jgi:cell volume regulation protein A
VSGAELVAIGHAQVEQAHLLILAGGVLGVLSIFAGLASRRFGAPVLLVFLILGMLAGQDGPGGLPFADFYAAYLVGSIALAVILFDGGLKTPATVLRMAFWPALLLASIGVVITAFVVGLATIVIAGVPVAAGMLTGAIVAPTDAAAVNALLRRARLAVPERVMALLEVESGLNDPVSIFLVVLILHVLAQPEWVTPLNLVLLFVKQMGGGIALGLAGGWILKLLLQRLKLEKALATVLVLMFALALFGGAQALGSSGFMSIFLCAVVVGNAAHQAQEDVNHFFEGLAWLAQIALFVMLGLLVAPHQLVSSIAGGIAVAAVLLFAARPAAVFACIAPFGFSVKESLFASWVGLRGAVPIYLTILPVLAEPTRSLRLFDGVFVVVIVSLVAQGWTIAPAARLLGYGRRSSR